jgi:hypothetical protein
MNELQETHAQESGASVTVLTGIWPGQSVRFGSLCHIRNLGLPLISVEFIRNQKGE